MRRRRLLATLAAGAIGATAGCGYAYGGGDLRDEDSIYASGLGTTRYVLATDRIVVANSGRIVDHERGGFYNGTSVTVADLEGNDVWRHSHWEPTVAVAGADPVYLLGKDERVVALAAAEDPELARANRGTADGEELWGAIVDGAQSPLASDDRGAYVAVGAGVAAVRDGEEAWRVSLPGPVESLAVADETLIAATSGAVVALSTEGRERWRRSTAGPPTLVTGGGRVAIRDGDGLTVTGTRDDGGSWSVEGGRRGARPTLTENRVYVTVRNRVAVFDAETGERRWEADAPVSLTPRVVPAPEGVYAVGGHCRAVALDAEGIRWTRELSVRNCEIVGGWLDGETVGLLLSGGELRWLQRADQNRGLL